ALGDQEIALKIAFEIHGGVADSIRIQAAGKAHAAGDDHIAVYGGALEQSKVVALVALDLDGGAGDRGGGGSRGGGDRFERNGRKESVAARDKDRGFARARTGERDAAHIKNAARADDIAAGGIHFYADGVGSVVVGDAALVEEEIVAVDDHRRRGGLDLHAAARLNGDVARGAGGERGLGAGRDGGVGQRAKRQRRSQQRCRGGGKHQAVLQNPNLFKCWSR